MSLHTIAFILLIVGGLNWLLFGFGYDLGRWLPGSVMMVVYILVGLSAIYEAVMHKKNCRRCVPDKMAMEGTM